MITIGSSYKSDVFYSYNNKIPSETAILLIRNKEILIKPACKDAETICFEKLLKYGDEVRICGLWLKNLGTILILCAYEGEMRIAISGRRT